MSNTLMESTSDTAEIAAEPTVATIMVSAVPISAVSTCSIISGMSSAHICFLVNIDFTRCILNCLHYIPAAQSEISREG